MKWRRRRRAKREMTRVASKAKASEPIEDCMAADEMPLTLEYQKVGDHHVVGGDWISRCLISFGDWNRKDFG